MVTKNERDSAKWVRTFEELDDNELILAFEICEKILKIRNCHCRLALELALEEIEKNNRRKVKETRKG